MEGTTFWITVALITSTVVTGEKGSTSQHCLAANINDCSVYYVVVQRHCTHGRVFNYAEQKCDDPSRVNSTCNTMRPGSKNHNECTEDGSEIQGSISYGWHQLWFNCENLGSGDTSSDTSGNELYSDGKSGSGDQGNGEGGYDSYFGENASYVEGGGEAGHGNYSNGNSGSGYQVHEENGVHGQSSNANSEYGAYSNETGGYEGSSLSNTNYGNESNRTGQHQTSSDGNSYNQGSGEGEYGGDSNENLKYGDQGSDKREHEYSSGENTGFGKEGYEGGSAGNSESGDQVQGKVTYGSAWDGKSGSGVQSNGRGWHWGASYGNSESGNHGEGSHGGDSDENSGYGDEGTDKGEHEQSSDENKGYGQEQYEGGSDRNSESGDQGKGETEYGSASEGDSKSGNHGEAWHGGNSKENGGYGDQGNGRGKHENSSGGNRGSGQHGNGNEGSSGGGKSKSEEIQEYSSFLTEELLLIFQRSSSFICVLDVSQTMSEELFSIQIKLFEFIVQIISRLSIGVNFGLVTYTNYASLVLETGEYSLSMVREKIEHVHVGEYEASYVAAAEVVGNETTRISESGKKPVVIWSSGSKSSTDATVAVEEIKKNATVICLGLGNNYDEQLVSMSSVDSDGKHMTYRIESQEEVTQYYKIYQRLMIGRGEIGEGLSWLLHGSH